MATTAHFVLASASPRRVALLEQIGLPADKTLPASIDETPIPGELPRVHAARLAHAKATKVAASEPKSFVLAADTVVACGRRILAKTETADEARQCLTLLSGRRHRVLTGVCLVAPDGKIRERLVTTVVTFKKLSGREIDHYIASDEWQGKAGGYAIQGLAAAFVRAINGSYTNVVGLPLFEVVNMLAGADYGPARELR